MSKQDGLRLALVMCREKFSYYADYHAAKEPKGGSEKEAVNRQMVIMIDCVLAATEPDRVSADKVSAELPSLPMQAKSEWPGICYYTADQMQEYASAAIAQSKGST